MEILNYNDMIRKHIVKELNYDEEIKENDIEKLYNEIMANSDDKKEILSVMLLTSYIVLKFTHKKFSQDKELKEKVMFYNNLSNVDELIDNMSLEYFKELCLDMLFYYTLDEYSKKEYVLSLKYNFKNVLKVFPCYINDLVRYSFKYSEKMILNTYNEKFAMLNDKDKALDYAEKYASELLIRLEEYDFDNYKKIVNRLSYASYCYNKFLLNNKNLKDKEHNLYMIENIGINYYELPYFLIDNIRFLRNLVKDYINYNLLSDDKKKEANNYIKKIEVNNLISINTLVRKILYRVFENNEKEESKIMEFIENSEFYDLIANVLYNDSMSLKYYDYLVLLDDYNAKLDYEFMKEINDIEDYKNNYLCDKKCFFDEINESINFMLLSRQEKNMLIKTLKQKNAYDDFINYNYLFDIIEFERDFDIYDAIFLYYNNLEEKKDVNIAIAESCLSLDKELEDLYIYNKADELFYNISKVFYIYIKYLESNKEEGLENALRIAKSMESDLELFIKNIKTNYDDRQTIMMWFYEFISLSDIKKDYIFSCFEKLEEKGKVKKLSKKNKNSN